MSKWRAENFYKYANCIKTGCDEYEGFKKYYSTGSIKENSIEAEGEYSFLKKPSRANRISLPGDIFQARMKSTNKALLIDDKLNDCLFSTGFIQVRPDLNKCLPKYIYYFVNSDCFLDQRDEYTTGSTQEALTDTGLKKIVIPIPSTIEEQQQIVKMLEERLEKLNNARAKLDKIPIVLKRFRQSVLASACSGKLTEKWREGKEFSEWEDAELHNFCSSIVDCPHSTPKWTEYGKLCVRTTNFKPNFLDLSIQQYVSEETFNSRISRLKPMPNDILYSREGGILGIACIIPENVELCLGQRMMLMRTSKFNNSKFLMYILNSPMITSKVKEKTGGSASPHLNVGEIKKIVIPHPPIMEQEEIVRRVDKLFAIADSIEDRYIIAKQKLDKAEKALYAKAFRGEL